MMKKMDLLSKTEILDQINKLCDKKINELKLTVL